MSTSESDLEGFGSEVARLASAAFGSLLHSSASAPSVPSTPSAGLIERPTLPYVNNAERTPWESPHAWLGEALSLTAPGLVNITHPQVTQTPSSPEVFGALGQSPFAAEGAPGVPRSAVPHTGVPHSQVPIVAVPSAATSLGGVPALSRVPNGVASDSQLVNTPVSTAAPNPNTPERSAAPGVRDPFAIDLGSIDLGGPSLAPTLGGETGARRQFDAASVRRDFPILEERIHGRRLVWLDNAATTQKPQVVIDRLSTFYQRENSNIHRAAHTLAGRATDAYEGARDTVRRYLNAPSSENIVFTRGATEAINLIAKSWGARYVNKGDEIVITWLEHHANIVPWQQLATQNGARLRVAPVDDRGQVILEEFERLLNARTRLVSFTHVSNALGTITPAREMVQMAHRHGARVLVDGAQAVSHLRVDVQSLDCDWYVFSGHKVFAPTGIGALYGKRDVLEESPPWQGGGNMIADVTFERTLVQGPPARFEAGTGNIADAAGLGAALDYVSSLGLENIAHHEHELLVYGTRELQRVPGLHLIGTAQEKAGVISFVIDGLRTEDLSAALDQEGIAVRSGHHCAQPILRRFGVESSVRASLAPYNTFEDIDVLVDALLRLKLAGTPPAR